MGMSWHGQSAADCCHFLPGIPGILPGIAPVAIGEVCEEPVHGGIVRRDCGQTDRDQS